MISNAIIFATGPVDIYIVLVSPEAPSDQTLDNFVNQGVAAGSAKPRPLEAPPANRLRIEVHDNGPGVPLASRLTVMNRFVKLQDGIGLGLGLPTVESLSKILKGACGMTDRIDGNTGCVFWVDVPVNGCEPQCFTRVEETRPVIKATEIRRCLVADDVGMNVTLAAKMLKKINYVPDKAYDGVGLLEKLMGHDADSYDFVLTDLHMPNKDGFAAVQEFRRFEDEKEIPKSKRKLVFGWSANDSPGTVRRCIDCGMNGVVPKPCEEGVILAKLREHRSFHPPSDAEEEEEEDPAHRTGMNGNTDQSVAERPQ